MSTLELEHYECQIRDGRIIPVRLNGSPVTKFRKPVTSGKSEKLYVVKSKGEVCYVGITRQGISARLRYGFNPNTATGYHGYAWKHLREVHLYVWVAAGLDRDAVEAIEAELVYNVRKRTGEWPIHQTEIHFHNPHPDVAQSLRKLAIQILESLR